ncbi:DUF1330 domain-containing protein [Rhodocytophaga aerolata]|uniref:DUF1330 domain-containing protein n=1 Tax=Rhodocytophaga aerolata TaxID=455078 RepID=A0ABT8RCS2_9BACT|nr:DUF1330 domain-containing protein [Rhodocytophaga aerolata]MDO1449124.1 DUF1330 domain-containing protein [Rhodocytophaga aerolata]
MIYYIQIIFVKDGKQEVFHAFEEHVLPLLQKHKGELLYRIRPTKDSIIASSGEHPYEIHLVSFPARKDFESYRDDKERLQYMHLKEASIEKALLIEGNLL